jgi:uncharacterized damage-inducible protein DinB
MTMTPDQAQLLFKYDAWANTRILDCCSSLTAEQFTRSLGSSFSSVRDTLAHIMGAQWVWLERFNGRLPAGLPKATEYEDLRGLHARWNETEQALLAYVSGLSATDLARNFEYRDLKGNFHSNLLWQTLQHLANHGTYHRGQVTTLLRQLGAQPVSTDLIAFFRERATQPAS